MHSAAKTTTSAVVVAILFAASLFMTGKVNESTMEYARATQFYIASCIIIWICAFVSVGLVSACMYAT